MTENTKIEQEDRGISINKYISSSGICSRREADKMLDDGKVKLNGTVAKKGNRVFENDRVTVNGKKVIINRIKKIYIAFNKPPGITCTTDKKDKSNIVDYLNFKERIYPIGRLDKNSTGLILLTNDGDIVNFVLRAKYEHHKEYIVTVNKPISSQFIHAMGNGIPILGTVTNKCVVEKLNKKQFRIILTQGLNRQIRRMCEFLDYKVYHLKRIRIMHVHLNNLEVGAWRNLSAAELAKFKTED